MVAEIKKSDSAAAQYVVKFFMKDQGGFYMWDELAAAAWIDPTLITKKEVRYMSVDVDHGAAYGNTLTWTDKDNPMLGARLVEIQKDLDLARFNKMFVDLMKAPTPQARLTQITINDVSGDMVRLGRVLLEVLELRV